MIPLPSQKIAGEHASVRIPDRYFSKFFYPIIILVFLVILGIFASPAKIHAGNAVARSSAAQDAGQTATPPDSAAAPKPIELPDGDGKPIATEYCQMCHKLTNLTKAHKNLDDWKETIQTMIDRGAGIPDDKVDTLAKYLAANFGSKDDATATNTSGATPPATSPAPATSAPSSNAAAGGLTTAKAVVELPDGPGKAIATEDCQACHNLTNLTKAHKSLDDWKDTVQTMIDRGANVLPDKVDTLVQYLAANFGPMDAAGPASSSAPSK